MRIYLLLLGPIMATLILLILRVSGIIGHWAIVFCPLVIPGVVVLWAIIQRIYYAFHKPTPDELVERYMDDLLRRR